MDITSNISSRAVVTVHGKGIQVGDLSSWRGLVASFISSQDVRESSRRLYTRTLSQFFLWITKTERTLQNLTRIDILEYKDSLLSSSLSSLTVGSYLTVIRKFYEWTESNKLYMNIAKGIKTPRRKQAFKKQHLNKEQIEQLLTFSEGTSPRNYSIINLMLRTGLRTIEVTRLDLGDITYKGGRRVLKIWGKGKDGKEDFVVLSDKAYQPIKEYLKTRKGAKNNEPLFTSESRQNKGQRLTTRTISEICKDALVAIGLDSREFTAHSLRHTTAVAILKSGGNITDVQDVLRHSNPATSQIYTESIKEELRLEHAAELRLDAAF